MTASPPAAPGRLHPPPERCPSGRRSTPGKCVWVNSPSRVRLEPPPGGERTRRRRSRRAAPKGVSRRRRRIIPPSPQPFRHHHPLPRSPRAGYDTFCDDRVPAAVAPGRTSFATERCPSGRRSTPGKCVWVNSPSRVRLEPPPGGERTRRRRSRRAAPKGVSRRRRRIIPPSPQPFRHHHPLPRSPRAGYDTFCDDRVPAAVAPGRLHSPRRGVRAAEGARLESVYGLIAHRGFESLPLRQKYCKNSKLYRSYPIRTTKVKGLNLTFPAASRRTTRAFSSRQA